MIAKQRTQTVTDTNLRREGEVNSSKNGQSQIYLTSKTQLNLLKPEWKRKEAGEGTQKERK